MKIAVLKGDGIGPEIVEAAQVVLNKVDEKFNLGIEYAEALFGGAAYDVYGNPYRKNRGTSWKVAMPFCWALSVHQNMIR